MDMRDLEAEVQRQVGYGCIVTGGIAPRGPYLNFNAGRRLVKVWLPRSGYDPKKIADLAKTSLSNEDEPAFREINYPSE